MAVAQEKLRELHEQLQSRCQESKPVEKEKLTNLDFHKRTTAQQLKKQNKQSELKALEDKIRGYQGSLESLAEYEDYTVSAGQEALLEEKMDWNTLSEEELTKYKGMLLRDYKQKNEQEFQAREVVGNVLHEMARQESFQDDFFLRPIRTLLELVGNAPDLQKQLTIISDSYESMIQKLEVDISMVQVEKSRVLELLTDYIREIHENLGKIDKNSTITVRGRNIKMLTIRQPLWEENQDVYEQKVQDLLEEVTKQGLALLEENNNLEELMGIFINTNNLYNSVVGNGNVEIRLYKIEEQKEYPIRWSDVAKNSGGEGFLSAFIVLTSLLYYMRRDDSDIFADRNEGKVLVMDNPFAQTNASHLLKPLMDMAKKTNTQLICLSGLGGDSIYNRFDNIYVLNLKASNLRGGQYLQGQHLRGQEPDTMIAARVHVEQQTLLF